MAGNTLTQVYSGVAGICSAQPRFRLKYLNTGLEHFDLFNYSWQGSTNIWVGLGPAWLTLATPLQVYNCKDNQGWIQM